MGSPPAAAKAETNIIASDLTISAAPDELRYDLASLVSFEK